MDFGMRQYLPHLCPSTNHLTFRPFFRPSTCFCKEWVMFIQIANPNLSIVTFESNHKFQRTGKQSDDVWPFAKQDMLCNKDFGGYTAPSGRIQVRSNSHQIEFRSGRIPVRSNSGQIEFRSDRIPVRSNSGQIEFRTDRIHVRSNPRQIEFTSGRIHVRSNSRPIEFTSDRINMR